MWGHFETVRRLRPVDLVSPTAVQLDLHPDGVLIEHPLPQIAPYAAVLAEHTPGLGPCELWFSSGSTRLAATYDDGAVALSVEVAGHTTRHQSRRHGRPDGPVDALGLTLTGTRLTAFTRRGETWTARARVDLSGVDTRDETWLASLGVGHTGSTPDRLLAGGFGQLGLRDLRLVSDRGGAAYRDGEQLLLTATSAGPGFFDTAHTSVWALDPGTLELEHRADLFFRRPDRPGAYGDHATHLVRDGERWLVATSTWGDFDRNRPDASVSVTLATTSTDLLHGRHLLDTEPLELPTTGLTSVGVWDPHLVHTGEEWLVGYVSARAFFVFHPVLATGPDLGSLSLRAAAHDRRATEGTTLVKVAGQWWVLASDGRDGRRGQRAAYPVLDLDLDQVGELDAAYPSNLPWPTLVPDSGGWLMVGFDGERYGGPLLDYGTHGDVVLSRSPGVAADLSRRPTSG